MSVCFCTCRRVATRLRYPLIPFHPVALSPVEVLRGVVEEKTMNEPLHVLIVEDNPDVSWAVTVHLTQLSNSAITTETVETLQKAVVRVEQGGVDAVILDLGLPDAVNTEAVTGIATANQHIPIVVVSGADLEYEAMAAGADDYIRKDEISTRNLVRALRHAASRRRDAHKVLATHYDRLYEGFDSTEHALQQAEAAGEIAARALQEAQTTLEAQRRPREPLFPSDPRPTNHVRGATGPPQP